MSGSDGFTRRYLDEAAEILRAIDPAEVDRVAQALAEIRERGGRLFALGLGGSSAHASHAAADFRKLCGLESYAATDNAAELTARINDEGLEGAYAAWLEASRLEARDGLLILSVGGGDPARQVSLALVRAMELARSRGAMVLGIVGRDGGATRERARACVRIPALFPERVTPHTEGLCSVVTHLLVSHPALARARGRWETLEGR